MEKDKENEGSIFVSLAYPEFNPAMESVKNDEVRKQLSIAKGNQAAQNEAILEKLL